MSKANQKRALRAIAVNTAASIRAIDTLSIDEWRRILRGDYGSYFNPIGKRTKEQKNAAWICHEAFYCEPEWVKDICNDNTELLSLLITHNQSHHSVTGIQLVEGVLYSNDNEGFPIKSECQRVRVNQLSRDSS
jgi:hypothetical protein